jgi:hypothetical protein
MRKKINYFYPVWVWLTTLTAYPLTCFVATLFEEEPNFRHFFKVYPIVFVLSLAFSVPMLIICWISFARLIKTNMETIELKLVLFLIAATGLAITFQIMNGLNLPLFSIYAVPLLIGTLIFRIRSRKDEPVKKYDVFEVNREINPLVPKGSRGAILEVWEDGVFEVEFVGPDGQNIAYDGRNTYTIYFRDIDYYCDPSSMPVRTQKL